MCIIGFLLLDTGDSLPLIVGGAAAAGIALATIVIAVVLLRRYMQIGMFS